eukprot:Skav204121  [mRNA]  locus=scaffold5190:260017:260716:- [translate_table: standard]
MNGSLVQRGITALHWAAAYDAPELVAALAAAGADVDATTTRQRRGPQRREKGAAEATGLRCCRRRGETPLHSAATNGAAGAARRLVELRAALDARNSNGPGSPAGGAGSGGGVDFEEIQLEIG